ncbi:trypsin-like serine peptidase [Ottowia caeni]|uniref:trypsin-like serine peptidase n=1 Tax=Ottowia caeni TaxID=2870339 RepID=UPI003D7517D7
MKIGDGREIPATAHSWGLASLLNWQPTADGGLVAGIEFYSEGARAIRLGVLVDSIPEGSVLRFYGEGDQVSESTSAQIGRIRLLNEAGGILGDSARMYWGADTAGAISTMEIQLPPGENPDDLRLAVPRLSHMYLNPALPASMQKSASDIGRSSWANPDVMCRSDLQAESRSVAKMVFSREDGLVGMCTGTLLNDASNSQTPYFLTANHCIKNQHEASTLKTYWFFRAAGCNRSPQSDQASTVLTGGAELLFSDPETDTALLRLNARPPAKVVYAGSYFGEGVGPGLDASSVHHPWGDFQKYSDGQVGGYVACGADRLCTMAKDASFGLLSVNVHKGIAEPGSSGSPLLIQLGHTRYVAGALYGYLTNCMECEGQVAVYGRLELAFPKGIGRWLTP